MPACRIRAARPRRGHPARRKRPGGPTRAGHGQAPTVPATPATTPWPKPPDAGIKGRAEAARRRHRQGPGGKPLRQHQGPGAESARRLSHQPWSAPCSRSGTKRGPARGPSAAARSAGFACAAPQWALTSCGAFLTCSCCTLDDDVAGPQAALGRRAVRRDLHHHHALRRAEATWPRVSGEIGPTRCRGRPARIGGGRGAVVRPRCSDPPIGGRSCSFPPGRTPHLRHGRPADRSWTRAGCNLLHLVPSNFSTTSPPGGRFSCAGHQGAAAAALQAQALGDVAVTCWMRTPSQPRRDWPKSLQLRDDRLDHVGRDREADADRAAGRRVDRGVHADHLAVHVEQRAAGIAAVDRGIGLDEVVVRARRRCRGRAPRRCRR